MDSRATDHFIKDRWVFTNIQALESPKEIFVAKEKKGLLVINIGRNDEKCNAGISLSITNV